MTLIDTHTHLYLEEFEKDIESVMQRAFDVDVKKFYLPSIDSKTISAIASLEQKFPGKCMALAGLHPCSVNGDFKKELDIIYTQLNQRPFAAIGESGLDFYWDKTFTEQQYECFTQQLKWAIEFNLPIVLHTRNATQESINVIRQNQSKNLRGIFHCFSGTAAQAKEIIDCGFHLGIGGVVTYKNSGLADTIKDISLDRIVLETDSPYLTPAPYRGERNESSYLKIIAEKIASVKNISVEEVAVITTENAEKIFSR